MKKLMERLGNRKKQGRKDKPSPGQMKSREQKFINRFSVAQEHPKSLPKYSALSDPHAVPFFANQKVRSHLRRIKRALKRQDRFSGESKRLRQEINRSLNTTLSEWPHPKAMLYRPKRDTKVVRNAAEFHALSRQLFPKAPNCLLIRPSQKKHPPSRNLISQKKSISLNHPNQISEPRININCPSWDRINKKYPASRSAAQNPSNRYP